MTLIRQQSIHVRPMGLPKLVYHPHKSMHFHARMCGFAHLVDAYPESRDGHAAVQIFDPELQRRGSAEGLVPRAFALAHGECEASRHRTELDAGGVRSPKPLTLHNGYSSHTWLLTCGSTHCPDLKFTSEELSSGLKPSKLSIVHRIAHDGLGSSIS